jgi:hypothetical protein
MTSVNRRAFVSGSLLVLAAPLGLLLVLHGCAHGVLNGLPDFESVESAGHVILIRESSAVGLLTSYRITVDGQLAWGLRNGEYVSTALPSGLHRIGVQCGGCGGWIPFCWRDVAASGITVEPQRTSYLLVKPARDCATITQIDEAAGKNWVSRSKAAPVIA